VVINNFHIPRIAIFKSKAQAPLVIDSDAPVTCTVARQGLKPVARWDAQFFDVRSLSDLGCTYCAGGRAAHFPDPFRQI